MATILIVEDRPVDRKLLATILKSAGHDVIEAADGSEALQHFRSARFDLLISDILMPKLDGYELVRRMRAMPALADIPVLFYTATYHEHEARELARRCGVADILKKPTAPTDLIAKVDALLGSGEGPVVADDDARDPPDAFARDHLQLVNTTLAAKVAALDSSEQRMSAIVDVAGQLAEELDPQRLLGKVADAAREVTLAQHAIIRVVRDTEGLPAISFMSGIDDELALRLEPPSPDTPAIAELRSSRRPVRLTNPSGDPAALGLPESHRPIYSALLTPLASATRLYGWLVLRNKIGADAFSEADERVTMALATHAGIAYENARLFAELRDTHERIQFALGGAGIGVWEWDVPADRVTWDATTTAVFGRTTEPRTSAAFFALIHPDDLGTVGASVQRSLSAQEDLRVEFRTVDTAGATRIINMRGRVSYDSESRPARILGVASDVTERRALEEQFRQAQKMEAIGQLAGGVAHDFNNLLTAIIGYAEFIAEDPSISPAIRDDLAQITSAAERSAALTRQLLAFSRTQVLQPRTLRLNELVTSTMQLLRRVIGEDIELVTALAPDLAPLFADPMQLEQIVLNLAVNARDAMPNGGRLTIETANVRFDEDDERGELSPGHYVMLSVSDTGIGMDDSTRRRIFEPFFTTKEQGKGTGLGLATVFGIVKQSGGHVTVDSAPGTGATFKIFLPPGDGTEVSERPIAAAAAPAHGTECVLLVEDEHAVRQLTSLILTRAGYTVLEAPDPEAAEREFARDPARIALLITDVVMPKQSGPALYKTLSELRPALKVLYTSGYTDATAIRDWRLDESAHFLQKPYTAAALKQKVREILEH